MRWYGARLGHRLGLWIPTVLQGAEIVHGDTNVIADMAKRNHWELIPAFSWAQGDGGPSEREAPDGGAGYYYFGDSKRYAVILCCALGVVSRAPRVAVVRQQRR